MDEDKDDSEATDPAPESGKKEAINSILEGLSHEAKSEFIDECIKYIRALLPTTKGNVFGESNEADE